VNAWFENLTERDRRIVLLGAITAAAILLIALILPLQRSVAATAQRVERKRSDLAWMRSAAPQILAAGPAQSVPTTQESLIVVIDRTAHESGLGAALSSSQPNGDGALRVRLDKAPFDLVVAWLARLAEQNAIHVESATIDAGGAGLVNAGLVLRVR
jgi:type II secretory pathway component PulM